MPKKLVERPLLPMLRSFINQIKKGKHLQKNGKRIKKNSINNYINLERLLTRFSYKFSYHLRIKIKSNLTKSQFENEKKYWNKFYTDFTGYLFDDLGHHDNHVGRLMKLLRCFFNYLINEMGYDIGFFHRKFYVKLEEVDIVVLTPERLNYLVYNTNLEIKLNEDQKKIKDVFVFGCMVALRYSDLMSLKKTSLETINDRMYIKIQSQKTQTYSRVKLPDFAINIVQKYFKSYVNKILPSFTLSVFNTKIKEVMEIYGFTEFVERNRQRRGISEPVYFDSINKINYRFCDAVTSHTMRRSAITIMLSLGMKEQMVRQISGHAPNSKEFYRYVAFAQNYIDNEIDMVHKNLIEKRLNSGSEM
jgi:site-specific recombinase XerD